MNERTVRDPNAALHELVDAHGAAVDSLLRGLEADRTAREDLWSEVFTVAYRRIDDVAHLDERQARAWLITVTRNVTANHARRATTRRRTLEQLSREPALREPSAEAEYLAAIPDGQRDRRISAAWHSLPHAHREVLALDANGLRGPDIALTLDISHQAARSRLMRARRAFLTAFQTCGATSHD